MSITTEQVQILVTAIDNASKTFQAVGAQMDKMTQAVAKATAQTQRLQAAQKSAAQTAKDLTYASVALASAGLGLFNTWDNYIDSQLRVDRANIRVLRSIEAVERAQKAYDEAIRNTTVDSMRLLEVTLKRDRAQAGIRRSDEDVLDAERELNIAIREEGENSIRAVEAREALRIAREEAAFARTEATLAEGERTKTIAGVGPESEVAKQLADNLKIAQETLDYNREMVEEMKQIQSKSLAQAIISTPIHLLTIIGSLGTIIAILTGKSILGSATAATSTLAPASTSSTLSTLGLAALPAAAVATSTYLGYQQAEGQSKMQETLTGKPLGLAEKALYTGSMMFGGGIGVEIGKYVSNLLGFQTPEQQLGTKIDQMAANILAQSSSFKGPEDLANTIASIKNQGGSYSMALAIADSLSKQAGWSSSEASILKAMIPKFAEGGLVTKPTLALIGERGPEMIVPLSGNEQTGSARQDITVYTTISIANVSSSVDLKQVTEAVSQGISSALKRRR